LLLLLSHVVASTHRVVSHATTHIATITVVWTLEVGPVILIAVVPLVHTKLVWHRGHLSATTTHGSVHSKVVHRTRSILISSILVEIEGRFQ
jgi:hypothetical protein